MGWLKDKYPKWARQSARRSNYSNPDVEDVVQDRFLQQVLRAAEAKNRRLAKIMKVAARRKIVKNNPPTP